MKILFVAPRVHQNQVPIIEGLIDKGHQVYFFVQRKAANEYYSEAKVSVISANLIYKAYFHIIKKFKGTDYAEQKAIYYYVPDILQSKKLIDDIRPDVVILRNRTLFSLVIYKLARNKGCKCLIYNQTPIFSSRDISKEKIIKKGVKALFPKNRITVVRYKEYPESEINYFEDKNAFFVPFVVRNTNVKKVEYCKDGVVHIFDSGKFRDYKNHFVLLKAVKLLIDEGYSNFHVLIQGQVECDEEEIYYKKIEKYIIDNSLGNYISLMKGVSYHEMENLFTESDIFVLPSKSEIANISIIDAMTYGLATISTSKNGTSDYISKGINGEIFKSDDEEDLAKVLKNYLNNIYLIKEHGSNASSYVSENCSFDSYYSSFMLALKQHERDVIDNE